MSHVSLNWLSGCMNDHRYNQITKNGQIFFYFGKHHGNRRASVSYLCAYANKLFQQIVVNLILANSTQMWRKIFICYEFTFHVGQYFFAIFCFHPASTISTQRPLLCRNVAKSVELLYMILFLFENYSFISYSSLTQWGLVTPYGGIDLGQHWLR